MYFGSCIIYFVIKIKARFLHSHRDRIVGLLGKDKAIPVCIKTRYGIHTFGMRFKLDVLVLDNQSRVVRIKHGLRPNSIFIWPLKYNLVLELPAGFVAKHKINIGDQVNI